jgi:ADP-ribose pyrophosphatase YjhB (NUDIX family)
MKLATLCYVKHEGRTLMVHRVKKADDIHQGKWNGLGGKLEPGESPEECVIREVREESGLEIHSPRYHGLLIFTNFKGDDWYVWVFTATELGHADRFARMQPEVDSRPGVDPAATLGQRPYLLSLAGKAGGFLGQVRLCRGENAGAQRVVLPVKQMENRIPLPVRGWIFSNLFYVLE